MSKRGLGPAREPSFYISASTKIGMGVDHHGDKSLSSSP